MMIDDLIDLYSAYHDTIQVLAVTTRQQYAHYLHRFLLSHAGLKVIDMTARVCRLYIMQQSAKSKNTALGCLFALRSLIKYAIAEGYLHTDPTASIEKIVPNKGKRKAYDDDTISKLFAAIDKKYECLRPKCRAILSLMVYGGLRISEVQLFRLSDLNMETGKLLIPLGKGGKPRAVYVCSECIVGVKRWALGRQKSEGFSMTTAGIRTLVYSLCDFAGIPKVLPHELRHSCATRLLINGSDIMTVKEFLGHESLATTQLYLHVTEEGLRKAAELTGLHVVRTEKPQQPSQKGGRRRTSLR